MDLAVIERSAGTTTDHRAVRHERRLEEAHWTRADWANVAVLCAVTTLLPSLISIAAGSYSLPQNDDWSYRRIAEHFAQTGHLVSNGWPSMTLIGQILWSWPFLRIFGDHGWVFPLSTAVLAIIGVSCAYYVARQVLRRWSATASVLLVALAPMFVWSTTTFLTDAPAFAAEMACLALGVTALRRHGWTRGAYVCAALAVGLFGFSIREFALTSLIAVLVCAGASDSPRRRYWYLAAGVLVLIVSFAIYRWWSHLPDFHHLTPGLPTGSSIVGTVREYYSLAFMLSPVVAFAAWRRFRWGLSWPIVTTAAVVVFGMAFTHFNGSLYAPNSLEPYGVASMDFLAGGRPELLPGLLWVLINLVGIISGALLAGIAVTVDVRHWRRWAWGTPIGLIGLFGALLALSLVAYGLLSLPSYDRYLWPLVFPLGVLLLHGSPPAPRREWHPVVAGIVASLSVLLLLVTAALTINADTYDAARWDAGQVAVSLGVPAKSVDAGFEWVGAHATGTVDLSLLAENPVPAYKQWYAQMEPGFRECSVVSGSPLHYANLHLVRTTHYELLGVIGRSALYVYRTSAAGC